MPKAFTVTGLHFGDEAKGATVDALVRHHGIKLVVRFSGGCQCAHNVITDAGIHHTFAQWGSGSLAGAATLLTQHVLVDPLRLMREQEVLVPKVIGHLPIITIHKDALVTTPYHAALNRLKERARGLDRHGSCGVGIGETVRYALERREAGGQDILTIGDLENGHSTGYRLDRLRKHLLPQARIAWDRVKDAGARGAQDDMNLFADDLLLDTLVFRYGNFTKQVRLVGEDEMMDMVSTQDTVWEGSQGVLLDEDYGFHPHTTWSRVTHRNAGEMLVQAGVTDVTNVGVLRVYGHRHGAGPFPGEDPVVKSLVSEPHNGTNEWQHGFRAGWFDTVLAKYAVAVGQPIHQLALTHLDQLSKRSTWPMIVDYPGADLLSCRVDPGDFSKRERLTAALGEVRDNVNRRCEMVAAEWVPSYISAQLGVPIGIVSRGSAYKDREFKGL